jgi:hypothetical protein
MLTFGVNSDNQKRSGMKIAQNPDRDTSTQKILNLSLTDGGLNKWTRY